MSLSGEQCVERGGIGVAADKVRFPNLSALRFAAALAVIIFHIEHKKTLYGFPSLWNKSYFLTTIGYHAVTFFFVLSGFLITYLLLCEKEQCGVIHVRNFYLRRVLRIFPVYFMTLVIGFFVLPLFSVFHIPRESQLLSDHFWPAFGMMSLFAANLAFAMYGNLACVDQAWSVSTEEQFYVFWPLLLMIIPRRRFWLVLVLLAVAAPLIRGCYHGGKESNPFIIAFLELSRFGCMAIGGLGALLVMHKNHYMYSVVTKPVTFAITMITTVTVLYFKTFPQSMTIVQPEVYSILFCILIVNFAAGCARSAPLDSSILRMGGDLSYSAYMYHNAFIALVCNLLIMSNVQIGSSLRANFIIYPSVVILTFLASWLSFRFMEAPMLKLKAKFSTVYSST